MKIKIEVDDKNLRKAEDTTKEIIYDLLAKYPNARTNLLNSDLKNMAELRV